MNMYVDICKNIHIKMYLRMRVYTYIHMWYDLSRAFAANYFL